ncbi:MAG: hypothetical protein II349_07360 [Akkermansia sp.]|nr:hypothetical protein [Akkermansia sp.]
MKSRILLPLFLAVGLLAVPVEAALTTPALAQASVKKAKKAKDGKKKNAKDKKSKKGKKGKKGDKAESYESPSSGKALCADDADLFSAPAVKAAEETKLTGALNDPAILAANAELALMKQSQGYNPMMEVHLERINNELRTKLAKAYLAQRCKTEPGDASVLSHQVVILGAGTILPAEDLATLMSSEKLVWSEPATIHSMAAKGAALQVVYKVGESYINTLLLSEDLATVYGVGETVSASEPTPAAGYKAVPTK